MDDDSKMIGGYLREVTSEPPTDPGGHSTPLLHQKPTVVQKKPGPQGGSGLLQYLPPGSQEENKGYMFWGGERLEDKVRKRGIKLSSRTVTGLSLALEADDKRRAGAKSNPMDKGLAGAGSKDKVGGKDDGTSIGKSINISNDDAESDANKSITSFHSNEAGKKKKKRKLGE
jgi:hypothetical protein